MKSRLIGTRLNRRYGDDNFQFTPISSGVLDEVGTILNFQTMSKNKKIFATLILSVILVFSIMPIVVSAQSSPPPEVEDVTEGGKTRSGLICPPYQKDASGQILRGEDGKAIPSSLVDCIPRLYNFALAISGLIFMGVIVAGGYLYITAGGDGEQTTKAKELIAGALSGMIILATAYVLLVFLNPKLVELNPPTPLDQDVRNKPADQQQQTSDNSVAPNSLTITNPIDNSQISKQSNFYIFVRFAVLDIDIKKVRVRVGPEGGTATELGIIENPVIGTSAIYNSVTWDIQNLAPGTKHTVIVEAFDAAGQMLSGISDSATITITDR